MVINMTLKTQAELWKETETPNTSYNGIEVHLLRKYDFDRQRQSAIEWIKNIMKAYKIDYHQLPSNIELSDIDKDYELLGYILKEVREGQKSGFSMIALLMFMNNITEDDLK